MGHNSGLKKGLNVKRHLFLFSSDDVWSAELLQLCFSTADYIVTEAESFSDLDFNGKTRRGTSVKALF